MPVSIFGINLRERNIFCFSPPAPPGCEANSKRNHFFWWGFTGEKKYTRNVTLYVKLYLWCKFSKKKIRLRAINYLSRQVQWAAGGSRFNRGCGCSHDRFNPEKRRVSFAADGHHSGILRKKKRAFWNVGEIFLFLEKKWFLKINSVIFEMWGC